MDLCCLDTKKKGTCGVENTTSVRCCCCCCSLWKKNDDDATEGAKKERRNRNREETGTRKRRRTRPSRGRVVGVFSREERKGFALDFYFFVPEFSLSSTKRASCVARDHCTHFASLGRASSSSVGPGGEDVKRGGRTR